MAQGDFCAGTGSEGKEIICRCRKSVDGVAKNTGCGHLNADDAQRGFIERELFMRNISMWVFAITFISWIVPFSGLLYDKKTR